MFAAAAPSLPVVLAPSTPPPPPLAPAQQQAVPSTPPPLLPASSAQAVCGSQDSLGRLFADAPASPLSFDTAPAAAQPLTTQKSPQQPSQQPPRAGPPSAPVTPVAGPTTPRAQPGQTPPSAGRTDGGFRMAVTPGAVTPPAGGPGPVLVLSGAADTLRRSVKQLVGRMGGQLLKDLEPAATHLVCDTNATGLARRTIKYLLAISAGLWIVRGEWVDACQAAGRWVSEAGFEVAGDFTRLGGPERGRTRQMLGLTPLLSGFRLTLFGAFSVPSRADAERLVLAAGAQLVPLQTAAVTHATDGRSFIVCDPAVDRDEAMDIARRAQLPAVGLSWVMDMVSAQATLDVVPYVVARP
jgi:hypothetical protein